MERITKKEFIKLLSENKSIFIGSLPPREKEPFEMIEKIAKEFCPTEKSIRRTVKKVQSNAICFNNDSWLYFDGNGEKTYWKIGNVICKVVEIDYSEDFRCSYDGIEYNAVLYYIEK